MNGVKLIAEQLLINSILSNGAPFTGKTKVGLGLIGLSGILLFIGTGFMIYAGYIWLSAQYSPELAAAFTGASMMAAALVCALCAYAFLHYRRYNMRRVRKDVETALHMALEFVDDELGSPIRENPKTAAAIALIAGFLTGDKVLGN
jgi:F0F1-type ATP synthase membrane subunit a